MVIFLTLVVLFSTGVLVYTYRVLNVEIDHYAKRCRDLAVEIDWHAHENECLRGECKLMRSETDRVKECLSDSDKMVREYADKLYARSAEVKRLTVLLSDSNAACQALLSENRVIKQEAERLDIALKHEKDFANDVLEANDGFVRTLDMLKKVIENPVGN